jgi:hypothetical protein
MGAVRPRLLRRREHSQTTGRTRRAPGVALGRGWARFGCSCGHRGRPGCEPPATVAAAVSAMGSAGVRGWLAVLVVGAGAVVYRLDRPGQASLRVELNTRDRGRLLERVQSQVEDLLWQPAGDPDPIRLGLAARPTLVTTPRDRFEQRLAEAGPAPRIGQVFDVAEGTLLVVGMPGAGKSRLLAELAQELIPRANKDPDERIPVIVSLASWTAGQPLAEWLASELRDRYEVPLELGRASVAAGQILPLLDGLDETVDPAACVDAINDFRVSHGLVPLAVCCRLVDYERLGVRLRLRGAIELQPPTREQVKDYLAQAGLALLDVEEALGSEQGWELLESLLTLSVVVRTYQAQPEALRSASGTAEQRRAHLFDAYVDAMLTRERSQPTPAYPHQQMLLAWLGWLAGPRHARAPPDAIPPRPAATVVARGTSRTTDAEPVRPVGRRVGRWVDRRVGHRVGRRVDQRVGRRAVRWVGRRDARRLGRGDPPSRSTVLVVAGCTSRGSFGWRVGRRVGRRVARRVGFRVDHRVGQRVGWRVGRWVGHRVAVGPREGPFSCKPDSKRRDSAFGPACRGCLVGQRVGRRVDRRVGQRVGHRAGHGVGRRVSRRVDRRT